MHSTTVAVANKGKPAKDQLTRRNPSLCPCFYSLFLQFPPRRYGARHQSRRSLQRGPNTTTPPWPETDPWRALRSRSRRHGSALWPSSERPLCGRTLQLRAPTASRSTSQRHRLDYEERMDWHSMLSHTHTQASVTPTQLHLQWHVIGYASSEHRPHIQTFTLKS